MEERNVNVVYRKTGESGGHSVYSCKVPISKMWLKRMGVTWEHSEVTLRFDGKRIIIERAGGQPMRQVPLASKRDIRRFALVWREMYKNHAAIPFYIFEDIEFMGEALSDLGFIMDCGNSAAKALPDVSGFFEDNEVLKRNVKRLDIQTLGNAIYSQWRYWNHWAMEPMGEENFQWFVIALDALAEKAECEKI